jgi:predicted PurR-regulated permease PerM
MLSPSNQSEPTQQGPTATREWTRRLIILLTILAALVLIVLIFEGAGHIIASLLIFTVAALIAYAIAPAVDFLHRFMPRALAILAVYLVVLVLLGLLMYFVLNTAITQISSLAQNIRSLLTPGPKGGVSPIEQLLLHVLTQNQIQTLTSQIETQLTQIASTIAGGVLPFVSGVAGAALNILLTIVISIYLLVDGSRAIRWLRKSAPVSQRGRVTALFAMMQHVIGGYIRGQILLCLIVGTIVGVGLAILRMPYAVLLGVLSFVTEFIPVLGTIFAGTVAVLLALTQGWLMAVLVLAYFVLVHIFEGYFLAPRLVGKSVGLNGAVALLALTIGGELFGPWGAIFASPVAGLLQAFAAAFWTYYRRTHSDEFPPDEVESGPKAPERLATTNTNPPEDIPVMNN